MANQRNSQLLVAEFENLLRDTDILGTHNNHCRLAEIGIVEQFAALLGSGNHLEAVSL